MSLTESLLFTLLLAAATVQASTRDEIERLWNPQGMAAQPAQPTADTSARTFAGICRNPSRLIIFKIFPLFSFY